MTPPPSRPRIYHITHIENLSSIAACGSLWSDSECMRQDTAHTRVGMTAIKARRLYELEVDCHPGTKVGAYVPFYFCPRSIMLYMLHRGNHPKLGFFFQGIRIQRIGHMFDLNQLALQYITDQEGEKTAVILPIQEF